MIMSIINWLNTNHGSVIAIATIFLVITNIVLVFITFYYSRLVQRQLKAADTPEIAVYLRSATCRVYRGIGKDRKEEIQDTLNRREIVIQQDQNSIDRKEDAYEEDAYDAVLCIENVGTGVARDLQFTTKSLVLPFFEAQKPFFLGNGVGYLEHGRKIFYQFYFKKASFAMTVTYQDSRKGKHERSFHLDPAELSNLRRNNELEEIADHLSSIQKEFGFSGDIWRHLRSIDSSLEKMSRKR